jgi:hypothetical protein
MEATNQALCYPLLLYQVKIFAHKNGLYHQCGGYNRLQMSHYGIIGNDTHRIEKKWYGMIHGTNLSL